MHEFEHFRTVYRIFDSVDLIASTRNCRARNLKQVAAFNREGWGGRHMQDFLAAIDRRSRPVADIEEGYISTASCILANVALDLRRTLAWDPQAGQVVADEEANRRRPYRAPWVHPEAARM